MDEELLHRVLSGKVSLQLTLVGDCSELMNVPSVTMWQWRNSTQLSDVKLRKTAKPKERESLIKEFVWTEDKAQSVPLPYDKWDATSHAWTPTNCDPESVAPMKRKLKVMSFNIWIKETHREARIKKLVSLMKDLKVDIVGFQETTENADKYLREQPYIRENFFLTPLTGQTSTYKICFLSRVPPCSVIRHDIPYRDAPRKAVQVDFNFGGAKVSLITVHLESSAFSASIRGDQLSYLYKKVASAENKIIFGDYNFHKAKEEQFISNGGFKDMWLSLHPKEQGATWGTNRLDRVTYNLKTLKAKSIEVIGRDPAIVETEDGRKIRAAISDHLGLCASFSVV